MRTSQTCLAFVLGALALFATSRASALPATPGDAVQFNGSTGYVTTFGFFSNPQVFTISVWFKTTTTQGGKLVGFGDTPVGASANYDRNIYMDNRGHIVFGVNPGSIQIVSNTVALNDGNWHQAVGTLSYFGLDLYVDGALVASNPAVSSAQNFGGVWKIGYDNLANWPDLPTSYFFNGTIDEVQIWTIALTASDVQTYLHQFRAGTETFLDAYYHFDDGSGTTTTDNSGHGLNGTLEGGVTWVTSTAPVGVPQVTNQAANFVLPSTATLNGLVLPNYQQTGAWFQYGLTTNYTFTSEESEVGPTNSASAEVSQSIGGLQPATLYHYQLAGSNGAGTNYGADLTFTTPPSAQFLFPVTLSANKLFQTSATFNGSLNPQGIDAKAWFEWGPTRFCGNSTAITDLGGGTNAVAISAPISGLQGGQLYHFHLAATNAFGKFIGADHIFTLPLLAVYGDNPLTNAFGVPFNDPGYGLPPASPLAVAASDDDELGTEENDFSLGLTANGGVLAWGYDNEGQTDFPAGPTNAIAISAGADFSLALLTNGTVVGWPHDYAGAFPPGGLTNVVAIAAGGVDDFALALQDDGGVVAWGNDIRGETDIPFGLTNVVAIAAGDLFCLALLSDGTVTNWGYNADGDNTPPAGLSNVVAIAVGNDFSLALQNSGTVVGWGRSSYHELPIPTGLTNVVDIAVGGYFGMVLSSAGSITGWGNNPVSGGIQVGWDIQGNGGGSGRPSPALQTANFVSIAAGTDFSLAFTGSGAVSGAGDSSYGNLNIPSGLSASSAPISVNSTVNVNLPGVYTVSYSVTNFLGAVVTESRTVVVTQPAPPSAFRFFYDGRQGYVLQFTGYSGLTYTVLSTTNLALPLTNWTVLGTAISLPNNQFQFSNVSNTTHPARYYMLRCP